MKLCVMNPVLNSYKLEDALKYLHNLGVQAMEVGAGGFPGDVHLKPEKIIGKPDKAKEYKELFAKYDIEIAAISCHGNPLHPCIRKRRLPKSSTTNLKTQSSLPKNSV